MNNYLVIIGTLAAVIVGGAAFAIWFFASENADRRKHYKITLTVKPDGTLGEYRSKLEPMGREPLTVVPRNDALICDLDVRLSDGAVTVYDLRQKESLERLWK